MTHDLGEQNLTLLESGRKAAAKAALDAVEQGEKEIEVEALTTGEIEAGLNVPITGGPKWIKGGTFTGFVRAKATQWKETLVGGFRFSKKF